MLGDLVAGFGDQQRALAVQIADRALFVVLVTQGDGLADQLGGFPQQLVEQLADVRRDLLRLGRGRGSGQLGQRRGGDESTDCQDCG